MFYAGIILACSVPIYYIAINYLWHYELDEHKIILTPEAGREDRFLIIGTVTLLTVVFLAILFGGITLINKSISHRVWQPFYKSLENIREFDLTKHNGIPFEETDIEEFHELNQSLQKLIKGNIAVFSQQKEFADNASHELQTPLAVIQSKLELLLQSQPLTDDQYNSIEDALKALSRVGRINKNLLLLAKIENSQYQDKEMLELSELLHYSIEQFHHFIENSEINIATSIIPGIQVQGNRPLVEILINNLLTNAIRYTAGKSKILIFLEENILRIENDGVESLRAEQVFKRFATASSQSPGTGLGLALVQQICERYQWKADYKFDRGRHVFTVIF